MSAINLRKCQRTTSEQASPRAVSRNLRTYPFARRSASPSLDSASESPSPPRRLDVIKNSVMIAIRKRTSSPGSSAVPQYRGVRHREELNKYVSEIRPTRCSKKIWLGTYDTAEEAARAFDIGNLCCGKNLPLNFEDSRDRMKRIPSKLSPEETRRAIANLAKEVARLYSASPSSSGEIAKPEPVNQTALPHSEFVPFQTHSESLPFQTHPEFVPYQAFQPQPVYQLLPQVQHLAAAGIQSDTYLEQLPEEVCPMEVATTMPVVERQNNGSRSWSFDLSISDVSLPDDLTGIFNDMPDVIDNHIFEDHMYQVQSQDNMYQDQASGCSEVFGEVYYYSL